MQVLLFKLPEKPKEKKKSSFVKAKTPEARKKQKQAIASYYAKKKIATKKEK